MTRIVVIGECMVEMAPVDGGLYRMGFAGDTFNMAWHLRYLLGPAHSVDYLSAVGDDSTSQAMLDFIQSQGVGIAHIRQISGASPGLYLIRQENGDRAFNYWRETSAARQLADDPAALARALQGADLVCLSGITLAILSPTARETLWSAIAASGAQVAFDPNIRPKLWSSLEDCRAVLTDAAMRSDVILPSFDDDAALFGDATPQATVTRYTRLGAGEVVVKDAARPALYSSSKGTLGVAAKRLAVPVVDATGAGDAFNAAWLAARLEGAAPKEALIAAHKHAARVLQVPGALLVDKRCASLAKSTPKA